MKVIVNRIRTRHINIEYHCGIAMVTAPRKATIQQIRQQLLSDRYSKCANDKIKPRHSVVGSRDMIGNNPTTENMHSSLIDKDAMYALQTGTSVLLGGHIYHVVSHSNGKTLFTADKLLISADKYYQQSSRLKAVMAYVKQYANINLRASISKKGCALSYCPSNIVLKKLSGDSWIDTTASSKTDSIVIDYRVVQLPYVCQDMLIDICYASILDRQPSIDTYVSNLCNEYCFIKHL